MTIALLIALFILGLWILTVVRRLLRTLDVMGLVVAQTAAHVKEVRFKVLDLNPDLKDFL